jgi:hypothetical protein
MAVFKPGPSGFSKLEYSLRSGTKEDNADRPINSLRTQYKSDGSSKSSSSRTNLSSHNLSDIARENLFSLSQEVDTSSEVRQLDNEKEIELQA